jgi:hypothetical protein
MQVLILGARRMNFQGNNGYVDVTKVTYIEGKPEYTEGQKGFLPMTVTADVYVFGSITEPGIYEVEFRQRPDSKGRPVLSMSHAELIEAVSIL